jgi:hypothetical protein
MKSMKVVFTFALALAVAPVGNALESYDDVAKSLVECTVFINPPLTETTAFINGQPAHLASPIGNPGFNDGNRFAVELSNTDPLPPGESVTDWNEINIRVYAFDSPFSPRELEVLTSANGTELSDFIDSARIVVSHSSGTGIAVEAVEVSHRITAEVLAAFARGKISIDNRAASCGQYGVHYDNPTLMSFTKSKAIPSLSYWASGLMSILVLAFGLVFVRRM